MLRVFLTIVLPLILPTALYVLWMQLARPAVGDDGVAWRAMPWIWLVVAGAALLALVLFVVTVHFGTAQPGTYVPPRYENGRILPGHVEPKPAPH